MPTDEVVGETVRDCGVPEPYPRAFEPASYALGAAALHDLLTRGGWRDVTVELVELECVWATRDEVLGTVFGTPFGPLVSALPADEQEETRARLASKLGRSADGVVVHTTSNIAQGVK